MGRRLYVEEQRFDRKELLIIGSLVGILLIMAVVRMINGAMPSGIYLPLTIAGLIALPAALWYTWRQKLKLVVNRKALQLSDSPFLHETLKIKWKNVISIEIIPLPKDYKWRGWNVHFSSGNKWYNINGKAVMKITLKNDKVIIIGCKKPDHVAKVLRNNDKTHDLVKSRS